MRMLPLVLLLVLACRRGESKSEPVSGARQVTALDVFDGPESATYDAAHDVWWVGNVVGDPEKKDGDGFISRVRADGTVDSLHFVQGGRDGAVLNGAKGMAIVGDTLWSADIDALRAFDVRTGRPLGAVDLAALGAGFPNDVAVGGDGALYVTDTGKNRIYRIVAGKATIAIESPALNGPNGIAWDARAKRFVVVSFRGKTILAWTPGDTTLVRLAEGPGQFDGVAVLDDGRLLVSSWADSSVSLYTVAEQGAAAAIAPVVRGVRGPADIGWDAKRRRLGVPQLMDKRVGWYEVP